MFKSGQTSTFKESWSNVSGGPARSHTGCFLVCVFYVLLNECFSLKKLCLLVRQFVSWCFCSVTRHARPYGMRWCGSVWGVGRCIPLCPWEATLFPVLWTDTDVCFRHFLIVLFKGGHWVLDFPGRYYFSVEDLAPSESVVFEKDPANQSMKTQVELNPSLWSVLRIPIVFLEFKLIPS